MHYKAQRHSKDEIYQRYPFAEEASSSSLSLGVDTAAAHTPMRAMLRPLLRESDFANWQKAAGSNAKWVSLLSEEQLSAFNELREGSELSAADTSSDASSVQPDHQQLLFGVAVIKNAIVVNSAAYLKVLNPITACFDCAKLSNDCACDSYVHVCACVYGLGAW
jgi:hypothetical protein